MFADIASRFVKVFMTNSASGERSRYLVGAGCPRLAFFYSVGLEALGGEFVNEEVKLYVDGFGTHVVFPSWEGSIGLEEMDEAQLLRVDAALPQHCLSYLFID
jgi:hypothetical protein